MNLFPSVDPIPVPAPIWLLKLLHIVTMALHFVAVQMLLGGLIVAVCLHLAGRSSEARTAAAALARRLPVVMTYVINLGVPPLLFAQVLYGRALYTSSVLMGAWWIAVIPLLMACYFLLYQFSACLEKSRPGWFFGVGAWLLAGLIAQIYSSNMTLMLRPEVWQAMYLKSPSGTQLPSGDPTMPWRLLTMFSGGLMVAGLWIASGEYSREMLRKPYVIGRHMYSNGVRVSTVAQLNANGYLTNARWTRTDVSAEYANGEAMFRGQCMSCHTIGGYRSIRRLLGGRDRVAIGNLLTMLHDYKADSPYRHFMPPLSGTPEEIRQLGGFLNHLVRPAPAAGTVVGASTAKAP